MLLEHDLRIIQELAHYIWRKHISTHQIPNSSIHAPNQKWLKSAPEKCQNLRIKVVMVRSGEHIGWVEVQTNHHFINMSKGHSIFPSKGSCLKMEGPFLNGWDPINDFKWQPTNFGGSPVFYVQSSPNWKSEIFHAMLGSEPSKIPPPTVPTPSKKSCVFLCVFAYWFLETKTWLCWMSCFFSISYICCVYSVWDGWVSVSQTIVFLCRGLDFLEQRKQAPKAHSTNLLKSRITKVYTANALPASHGGWGESEKNSKYCWWFFRNPGWKPPGMYKTL